MSDYKDQSALRAIFAEQARALEKKEPREPQIVSTVFGEGWLGPHQNHEAQLLLAGEKPVGILTGREAEETLPLLLQAAEEGLLSIEKRWEDLSLCVGYYYYICQPGNEDERDELIAINEAVSRRNVYYRMPGVEGWSPYSMLEEVRIGEILGYASADIAAFVAHCGYDPVLYLDPVRRVEAEKEQENAIDPTFSLERGPAPG